MTEATARFGLPLLVAGQAQKEIYHNEAISRLDLVTQAVAEACELNDPPVEPLPGQCWILGTAPTGDWQGHPGEIAGWTEGGWRFVIPREGMRLWLDEARGFAGFVDGRWQAGRTYGRLFVDGEQVIGPRLNAIAEPLAGTVVDAEARAAVSAVLVALRAHGLIEPGGL